MAKRNISFTKPPEPSFIKKMKESMGYQEPDTIETKMQVQPYDAENDEDRDDEKPAIVVLKPGDLTEEDVKQIQEKWDENKKIMFSKPVKKDSEEKNALDFSSKKRKDLEKRISSEKEKTKQVKNTSLLSFDEEEDY